MRQSIWQVKNELRDKMLDYAYDGGDLKEEMYQAALECWRALTKIIDESR